MHPLRIPFLVCPLPHRKRSRLGIPLFPIGSGNLVPFRITVEIFEDTIPGGNMRGFVVTLALILVGAVAAMNAQAGPAEVGTDTGKAKVYGAGVSAADTVMVSAIMANPDAYVGKVVRVQGVAVDVCAHRGCWVNISSDTEGQVVRLKVTDGEIVFPVAIKGDVITAEGVWTANKLDLETTKAMCAYEAEQKGENFDPNSVTSCKTLYQITGSGAVVVPAAAVQKNEQSDAGTNWARPDAGQADSHGAGR